MGSAINVTETGQHLGASSRRRLGRAEGGGAYGEGVVCWVAERRFGLKVLLCAVKLLRGTTECAECAAVTETAPIKDLPLRRALVHRRLACRACSKLQLLPASRLGQSATASSGYRCLTGLPAAPAAAQLRG